MKKIFYVLLIVVLVAIYANIGYYLGQEWNHARGSIGPNVVQKILLGPNKAFELPNWETNATLVTIGLMLAWPVLLIALLLSWVGYFVFFGALFKILGLTSSILAAIIGLVVVMMIWRHHHKKNKIVT